MVATVARRIKNQDNGKNSSSGPTVSPNAVDQIGAIVVGNDADTGRQRLVDLFDRGAEPLRDHARVLAQRHEGDAHHRLAVACREDG
jgi:hypothetical protein